MNISARNIWPGTVTHIETGAVNDVVSVKLRGGAVVTSVITKNSVQRLGLKEGSLNVEPGWKRDCMARIN